LIIGIGIDEVEVERFARSLARTPTLARRLFTTDEQAYAASAPGLAAQRLAVRFAAKEAALKAMGVGLGACRFVDLEVARDAVSGAPSLRLHGTAGELAAGRGVQRWHLSLSHTDVRASAFVIAEGSPGQ
jgi:holo-[acyl-carrier protein] synthase